MNLKELIDVLFTSASKGDSGNVAIIISVYRVHVKLPYLSPL
jgi:hypothetical protein